jgi:hypothetical protein
MGAAEAGRLPRLRQQVQRVGWGFCRRNVLEAIDAANGSSATTVSAEFRGFTS